MTDTELIDIVAPPAGVLLVEATVLEWIISVGQTTEVGQALIRLSSGKLKIKLPSLTAGELVETIVSAGDIIVPGQLLGRIKPNSLVAAGMPSAAEQKTTILDPSLLKAVYRATSLVRSYRTHGHLAADLDPLGSEPIGDPSLDPSWFDLSQDVMRQISADTLNLQSSGQTLAEALPELRKVYCSTIAYEFEHITDHVQRRWLRKTVEQGMHLDPITDQQRRDLLKRLLAVDAFERFLHKTYLGQKQFSIEGLDMTVPMLDQVIRMGAKDGADDIVIGMAHRGRLNVLAHNLSRPYQTIFGEFEGDTTVEVIQEVTELPKQGTGDVKYHQGYSSAYQLPQGGSVDVHLRANPSHLEFVNPVVLGSARASQTEHYPGPKISRDRHASVPIVLHGDAAFPGQGVVSESLNLQALEGYQAGGALHLIQNNQLGFTTDPSDARSTHWASDLAKGFDMPIIHVNADHPEACLAAVNLAMQFRSKFGHDVLVDLIGYRRFGHNEADEPAFTQPQIYQKIKNHQPVCQIYAEQLIKDGVVTSQQVDQWTEQIWDALTAEHDQLKNMVKEASNGHSDTTLGIFDLEHPETEAVETAVSATALKRLNSQLLEVPEGFVINKKLGLQLERRLQTIQQGNINWGQAEALALGSLLLDGIPVRMTGQDCQRGTFSHRHMVFHDSKNGQSFSPIQNLAEAKASIEIHNSPLSETACLGFEYGYAIEQPDAFVLWEAQFGDFANGAQVIIDQFMASSLSKWGESSRLTLLLPHGYEGSGPDHSSARLERFLQLCAEGNLRVANPSTPAQYFHLLRRQALTQQQRPLIIMTPKSLLRLPEAVSSLEQLSSGYFQPVIADRSSDRQLVQRLVLCSGKIFYDLSSSDKTNQTVAVARVEQLYPFPEEELIDLISSYPNLQEVAWVQEEPRNMGAREFMLPRLHQLLPEGFSDLLWSAELGYIGRPERAAPGEGYPAAHRAEQQQLISTALDIETDVGPFPDKTPGER